MGVSKVNYGNNTLIDLTGDTVDPNNLKRGETAHNRDGNQITGAMDTLPTWYGTLAEYEQLTPEEEANYLFFEPYDEGGYGTAADKSDLTNIDITGATNNTGSTITKDTFFYLNGDLVQAKADIANNASFTLNTNYEIVTAGGLNKLNGDIATLRSSLADKQYKFYHKEFHSKAITTSGTTFDLTSLENGINPVQFRNIIVSFVDQNNIGAYIKSYAITAKGSSYYLYAQASSEAYFKIVLDCVYA